MGTLAATNEGTEPQSQGVSPGRGGGVPYRCRPLLLPATGSKELTCCRSTGSEPATAEGSHTGRASCQARCDGRRGAGGAPHSPGCGTAPWAPAGTSCCRTQCSTARGRRPPPGQHSHPDLQRASTPGALRAERGPGGVQLTLHLVPCSGGSTEGAGQAGSVDDANGMRCNEVLHLGHDNPGKAPGWSQGGVGLF